jgi:uroporphyrin-III C-methyltransferase/precorrin-2 dehydrogenase/sirohydrochlorin ferrochelatase
LPDLVEKIAGGPAILIIGDVVAHAVPARHQQLNQLASYFQVAAA